MNGRQDGSQAWRRRGIPRSLPFFGSGRKLRLCPVAALYGLQRADGGLRAAALDAGDIALIGLEAFGAVQPPLAASLYSASLT